MPGFNTDFKYKGQVYHAQTEDNGLHNPVVVTLLYLKGAILASKKTSYRDIVGSEGFQKDLMEIMKGQHREIMREVLAGRYDAAEAPALHSASTAAAAASPVPEPQDNGGPKSLDDAIVEYLERCAAGRGRGA